MLEIRRVKKEDYSQIWKIIKEVISKGDTYVFSLSSSKEKMLNFWCGNDKRTYVAVLNEEVVGTFFLKENQPDLGSHVCNAGYMVAESARGKSVGRKMAEFSIAEAKKLCFKAMQFNFVVKSNVGAIKLWKKLGFEIIGEIPEAFNHKEKGLTNAYIMYRRL